MQLVDDVYTWIDRIIFVFTVAIRVWAVVDCATRKARAFPAANKLTKLAWLSILVATGVLGSLFFPDILRNPIGTIMFIAALVYLCDVRPAVREVSGGSR